MEHSKVMVMVVGLVTGVGGAMPGASAQPTDEPRVVASATTVERRHSINLDPLGLALGAYNLNYEYLRGGHGLVAEGAFSHSGGDAASVTTYGGAAGWRWHWRGRQNSGFVGVMAGLSGGTAEATVGDSAMPETFDLTLTELSVTANVGKRWQLASGLNVTARVGAGRAWRWFSTSSMDPDAQQAVDDVESIMDLIPIALDGELSLGYSF